MSLFDVIKYPISIPSTIEQLEALPKELFKKWTKLSSLSRSTSSIAHYYHHCFEISGPYRFWIKGIDLLRKMISEYEE